MDEWERNMRLQNQQAAEAQGIVADSMDVRMNIVARIESGEITLEQGQSELKKLKRAAGRNGKITREQAWRS